MSENTTVSTPPNPADAGHEIRTYFVRNRNALVARGFFSELFVDYFLHAAGQRIRVAPEHAEMFKRALAGFALHLASRPRNETIGWTIHFQQPLVNLFLAGDNEDGFLTGRVLDENVRDLPGNSFHADIVRPGQPMRRSTVDFDGADPLAAVEKFHAQSEQRPCRFFQLAGEDFVMVGEQPDCDKAWFDALTPDAMRTIDTTETLALLEKRVYRWRCGCDQRRMMQVVAPAMMENSDELFGGESKIEIRCPRCAARHVLTRESLEAFVASEKK